MRVHAAATLVFSVALVALGTAILVRTVLLGGGIGFGLGAIVLCAGIARLYVSRRT
jgi:hypothetical protein